MRSATILPLPQPEQATRGPHFWEATVLATKTNMAPISSIPENALKYLSMHRPNKVIDAVQLYPDVFPVLADPKQPRFRSCWGHENLCNVGVVT